MSSDYSKVDINTERVRIVSKRMEVAVPSDDGEDDVLRVDADGDTYFAQSDGRCPFLCADGLCELQRTLGAQSLCRTCRDFPRWEVLLCDRADTG